MDTVNIQMCLPYDEKVTAFHIKGNILEGINFDLNV